MPRGAAGIERQPEGVLRTTRGTLAESAALLYDGRPFHAHEVFEDAWKTGEEPLRAFWRAMAQLAVGLTHAARGNSHGATRLTGRARAAFAAPGLVGPPLLPPAAVLAWIDVQSDPPGIPTALASLADLLTAAVEDEPGT